MRVIRAHIKGYTASFRYPIFISGFQPSLPVPPLSTVYGFLSASKGEPVIPADTGIGYVFKSSGKFVDVETTYELEGVLGAKSNICKREILTDPDMYLYVADTKYGEYLKKPFYPLLLGRSSDLCMVDEVRIVELEKTSKKIKVGKTIVPFETDGIHGIIQSLPAFITTGIPRKTEGTRIFYIMEDFIEYRGDSFYYDEEMDWGVYMHYT